MFRTDVVDPALVQEKIDNFEKALDNAESSVSPSANLAAVLSK